MQELSWRESVEKVEHLKALGKTDLYLYTSDEGDRPWEFVDKVEPGGSHRLEIATSVSFYATHPCGLTFRWSFDIESRDANGTGSYRILVDEIKKVLVRIPMAVRESFSAYLEACAVAINKKGQEYEAIANRQFETARELRRSREWS